MKKINEQDKQTPVPPTAPNLEPQEKSQQESVPKEKSRKGSSISENTKSMDMKKEVLEQLDNSFVPSSLKSCLKNSSVNGSISSTDQISQQKDASLHKQVSQDINSIKEDKLSISDKNYESPSSIVSKSIVQSTENIPKSEHESIEKSNTSLINSVRVVSSQKSSLKKNRTFADSKISEQNSLRNSNEPLPEDILKTPSKNTIHSANNPTPQTYISQKTDSNLNMALNLESYSYSETICSQFTNLTSKGVQQQQQTSYRALSPAIDVTHTQIYMSPDKKPSSYDKTESFILPEQELPNEVYSVNPTEANESLDRARFIEEISFLEQESVTNRSL